MRNVKDILAEQRAKEVYHKKIEEAIKSANPEQRRALRRAQRHEDATHNYMLAAEANAKNKAEYKKRESQRISQLKRNKTKDRAPSEAKRIYHDETPINWEKYDLYLKSNAWAKIRKKALTRASHKCQLCYSKEHLHVHHRTYDRIFQEHIDDVIVLCEACHTTFHKYRVLSKS